MLNKIDKIKTYWSFLKDKKAMRDRSKTNMSGLSLMHEYYNLLVSGEKDYNYLNYFFEKYFKNKKPVIASLGCGDGHLERVLINKKFLYSSIEGFDVNTDLVNFANQEAVRNKLENLAYFELDLNNFKLNKKYDLIIFFHSLHHVEKIESCLEEVSKSLNEEGLVLVVEFVGPSRFQWTSQQINIAQGMLDALPPSMKINLKDKKESLKEKIKRPSIQEVVGGDPSEAIRSEEIEKILEDKFVIKEKKHLGGTLLNLLFEDIAGNFDEKDEKTKTIIRLCQNFERELIENKVIKSDFVFIVLENKKSVI